MERMHSYGINYSIMVLDPFHKNGAYYLLHHRQFYVLGQGNTPCIYLTFKFNKVPGPASYGHIPKVVT